MKLAFYVISFSDSYGNGRSVLTRHRTFKAAQTFARRITHACCIIEDQDGNAYSLGRLPIPGGVAMARRWAEA